MQHLLLKDLATHRPVLTLPFITPAISTLLLSLWFPLEDPFPHSHLVKTCQGFKVPQKRYLCGAFLHSIHERESLPLSSPYLYNLKKKNCPQPVPTFSLCYSYFLCHLLDIGSLKAGRGSCNLNFSQLLIQHEACDKCSTNISACFTLKSPQPKTLDDLHDK